MSPSRRRTTGAVLGFASRAHARVPPSCSTLVSRRVRLGGRARCPHRAAAAWQVAHAESFACRSSVRGTVRGRAAHPARYLATGPPGSRPTAITPENFACVLSARCAPSPARHRRAPSPAPPVAPRPRRPASIHAIRLLQRSLELEELIEKLRNMALLRPYRRNATGISNAFFPIGRLFLQCGAT